MKNRFWIRFRAKRLSAILIVFLLYINLAIMDGMQAFAHTPAVQPLPLWIAFGFSLSVALIFFAVGSLIWFYSRNRQVASLLFFFTSVAMIAFELEIASSATTPEAHIVIAISGLASVLSIVLFAVILLVFPKDHLKSSTQKSTKIWIYGFWQALRASPTRWYILALFLFLCLSIADTIISALFRPTFIPSWLDSLSLFSPVFALTGCLITVIASFRQSTTREREQLRFFVSGVVIAVVPLLFLTVLPQAIGGTFSAYAINAQITTLTVVLIPLSLGYAVLRYQILVLDTYIRRTVNWVIGAIFLTMLVYTVVVTGSRIHGTSVPLYVVTIAITMAVLAPTIWWLAKLLTEQVLFRELLRYRRLLEKPIEFGDESFDLETSAQLVTADALQTFKTTQVGLFILIEDTGCYHIFPPLLDNQSDGPRRTLVERLSSSLSTTAFTSVSALTLQPVVEERLTASRRPLLLHEVTRAKEDIPTGLSRYLTSTNQAEQNDPLLVPVKSQGKMIGMLVLGERGDQQSYAGPDFEIAQLLLSRYSYLLETARLQQRSRQHAILLGDLYKASILSTEELPDLEKVADFFANIAAQAMKVGVEIWLYNKQEQVLRYTAHVGGGPQLLTAQQVRPHHDDWLPYYYVGQNTYPLDDGSTDTPPCITQKPSFPFVWLPLHKNEQRLGILVLTYPRTHLFFQEEIHVLEMFASQCAAALENTRITAELRIAYEHQKELDALKDQFIMTASHELRTPLTAVLGYIELLEEYNKTLDIDMRADFIAKAHRGCSELALMVNNIMDANRVQVDASNIKLSSVSLRESVVHVVEIIEAMAKREQRTITQTIPSAFVVLVDAVRLRQVLLNLVSNALKYSAYGTNIEISAEANTEYITVCVRDHGFGVPLEEQKRLFERFVRLERDLNSPIRGAGLGLSICKQLVEAMGGTIWVTSSGKEGEGSSFFFTVRRIASIVKTDLQEQGKLSIR